MKLPICQDLPQGEDIDLNEIDGLNVQTEMDNPENNVPVSSSSLDLFFSSAPTMVEQDSQVKLTNHDGRRSANLVSHVSQQKEGNLADFEDIMATQQAFLCALLDPDQVTPVKLLHQSPYALKNHYASSIPLMSHSGESSTNVTQHTRSLEDNTFRIIFFKGQIVGLCINPYESRLIQHALETAAPEEIIMVYEEVIPYARMLATDAFANHVVQKLLEHGPQLYKRKFINHLIGHVLPLSLHMYGCHVIQKAFEVGDLHQKVHMANEFRNNVLECARDQYANQVIQKCMECVPPQHNEFIFSSFCEKAKEFSIHPSGCHVIQKALALCNHSEIRNKLLLEILEAAVELAPDPYGSYVLLNIVEHGGPGGLSMIVNKLNGRIYSMSYHIFASNVIKSCLTFGDFMDRQLITIEILSGADQQHFDHLLDMMCHPYANFVIQTLLETAEEGHQRVLMDAAERYADVIVTYPHGRCMLARVQRLFAEKGRLTTITPLLHGY